MNEISCLRHTRVRLDPENTIEKGKKSTKISIEIGAISDETGGEGALPAFQSCIACGKNPMDEHPAALFFLQNSPIVNMGKYVSAIRSQTIY